tara:strand:- start:138 stop:311 length:174 start_codon:yes stop_codon:yes gene_type:complete
MEFWSMHKLSLEVEKVKSLIVKRAIGLGLVAEAPSLLSTKLTRASQIASLAMLDHLG